MIQSTTTRRRKPEGLILWQGQSAIDGSEIVVILTGTRRPTRNEKTGDMLQTWILRADQDPTAAINTGADESICGDCPLRGMIGENAKGRNGFSNRFRSCYVQVSNAPRAVWHAWRNGKYERYNAAQHNQFLRGRLIRFGSYGDPVAAPYRLWRDLASVCESHTGYTHQWDKTRFWRFRRLIMASVHSIEQGEKARRRGWRYFRTVESSGATEFELNRREFVCPASAEQDYRLTCATCRACDGAGNNAQRASVVIVAHGSPGKLASYDRMME